MRNLKRPIKARPDTRSSSASSSRPSSISKPKKLQKSLNSLLTFLNRFDQIDHTIFETVTSLNSFICEILSTTQKHPSNIDYTKFQNIWAKIKNQLSNNIITLNGIQMPILINEELNKFMNIIHQVDQNPPNSEKLQRESKNVMKGISSTINSARINSNKKQFDQLKIQISNLRSSLGHQYESFFKQSQVSKEWKETIIDDSRKILDKIINFCDVGKEIGLTEFPFVDEISILLNELSNESEIMKDNAKSLIPRHSPMKFEQRKSNDQTPMKTIEPKIKRVPCSARSKSEQSGSRISRIPKPKEQTTPDRPLTSKKVRSSLANTISKDHEIIQSDKKTKTVMSARSSRNATMKTDNSEENSNKPKPALSRSQKPARASSISSTTKSVANTETIPKQKTNLKNKEPAKKKKEIIPLQESPKIQREPKPRSSLSSSQQVTFKKLDLNDEEDSDHNENKFPNKISFTQNNKKKNQNNDLIENIKKDLISFEQRFLKYAATIETNDLLGEFINEIRSTQKSIDNDHNSLEQHAYNLSNIICSIEEKMDISKPIFEIEQNLNQALTQMSNLSKSMSSSVASNAEIAEANSISKQFEIVKEQLEKIIIDRRDLSESELTTKLEIEFDKFCKSEKTFKNAQENNETLKRLRKENIEMRKEIQSSASSNKADKQENYKKIMIEMKAVNQRISEIQIERRENPEESEEIDSELDALIAQQNDLIEQLSSFEF